MCVCVCVCAYEGRALWAGCPGEQRHGETQRWGKDSEPKLPMRWLENEMEESCGQCLPHMFPFNPNIASFPNLLMRN